MSTASLWASTSPVVIPVPQLYSYSLKINDWFDQISVKFSTTRPTPDAYPISTMTWLIDPLGCGGIGLPNSGPIQVNCLDPFLHAMGIPDFYLVASFTPLASYLDFLPFGGDAWVNGKSHETHPHAKDPVCHCVVHPTRTPGQPGMSCPTICAMVTAHHELAIGIRLSLSNFNLVVLVIWQEVVVEFHCTVTAPEFTLSHHCPGVRMAEDRGIFLYTLINTGYKADVIILSGICRPEQVDAEGGGQILPTASMQLRARSGRAASDTTAHELLSRNIFPSSFSFEPILIPTRVMPRIYHSPSHRLSSQALRTFSAIRLYLSTS